MKEKPHIYRRSGYWAVLYNGLAMGFKDFQLAVNDAKYCWSFITEEGKR